MNKTLANFFFEIHFDDNISILILFLAPSKSMDDDIKANIIPLGSVHLWII